MAGIGFELNKLLKRNSFFSEAFAFFYSANISAGPWIVSSTIMFLIQTYIPQKHIPFLISGIIYTFIFSTILFGSVSTSVTRYLSDLIYKKQFAEIYNLYTSSAGYAFTSSGIFLIFFFIVNKITEWQKIILFSYSLTALSVIWVQVIFVSAIRRFMPVILSFLTGGSLSLFLTLHLYRTKNEYYAYAGYNVGLMFIMVILQLFIRRFLYTGEFDDTGKIKDEKPYSGNQKKIPLFITSVKKYKKQAISGTFTYMAAWIDDFIAWVYFRYSISKGFIFAPQYDIPMFISYLFIIPTLSLFVLNLETEFYTYYRIFYKSIEENRTLRFIELSKQNLDESLKSSTKLIVAVQFAFMLAGLILSKSLAELLRFNNYGLMALRVGIIGAAANGVYLYISLIAHYFDLPDIPLKSSILAFSVNLIISSLTIPKIPGVGFLAGFIIADIYSFISFSKIYSSLLLFEFSRNRLSMPKREVIVHENK
ncbi:MAG: exopolysaccharide Pel transporter PelG [Fervidobacterium sp.]